MNKLKRQCKMNTTNSLMESGERLKPESCRICLTVSDNMRSIYNRKLLEHISYCTGVKIKNEDGLPANICNNCQTRLATAVKFKKLCILTEQICQNILKNRIKTELKSINSFNSESNDDYFNDNYVRNDHDYDSFNDNSVKKDHLNDNFSINYVKEDHSDDNYNENHMEDLSNEIYIIYDENCIKEEHLTEDKSNDHFNDNNVKKDQAYRQDSIQNNGLTVVKQEEITCEFTVNTEGVPKRISKNLTVLKKPIGSPQRQPKSRKIEEITGNVQQSIKKRGPYRKKNELPKRRKKNNRSKFTYTPLFCVVCQIKFSCKKDFHEHRESLHKETWDSICEVCGKQFLTRGSFLSHIRSHLPAKHACNDCDYRTANKSDLVKHLLIHSGVKKYQCSRCPNNYHTVSNLRDHERIVHERLVRYACGRCGKMFYDRTHLRRHEDSHNDVKRFVCQVCNSAFSRRTYWKKHLLKQHSITTPALRPGRERSLVIGAVKPE